MIIPDDVLDALYAEDEKTMKKALVSPLALYYDGMIYTVNELRDMSADEIKGIGIPSEELNNFTNNIDILIKDHVGEKLYDLNYKNTINNLRKITAE